MSHPDDSAVAWLAAVLGDACTPPPPTTLLPAEATALAQREGIAALVSFRLRQVGREVVSQAFLDAFSTAEKEAMVASMVLDGESQRVLGRMAASGIPGLLLKGSALAHWAYPQAHLRACSDIDLLLASRRSAEELALLLEPSGYFRAKTSGDLVAYELLCKRDVSGGWQVELDIHWRLTNSPLFSHVFGFDELMADSIGIPQLAPNARGLGPVHALLNACMHRALNLSIGIEDRLKWQYDLINLMDLLTPAQWQRLESLSIDKKVAAIVASGLRAAALTFRREIPGQCVSVLSQAGAKESLDADRLTDWSYMQRQTWKALPQPGLRLRWLWQRLFPSRDYLEALYGKKSSYAHLLISRFKFGLRHLRSR